MPSTLPPHARHVNVSDDDSTTAFANEAVTFGTNWFAEPEHGGYYQAVADGTYAACGLDVTIMQGGPQGSLRPLLLAGKIQAGPGISRGA